MWNRASLKFKLISSFLGISIFLVVVGGIGYWTLQNVVKSYSKIAEISLPNMVNMGDMRASAYGVVRNITLLSNPNLTDEKRKNLFERFNKRLEEYAVADKAYQDVPFLPGEGTLYDEVSKNWKSLTAVLDQMKPMVGSKDVETQKRLEKVASEDLSMSLTTLISSFDKLRDFHKQMAKANVATAQSDASKGSSFALVAVLSGCLISAAIGFAFASSLARRFNGLAEQLLHGAEEVASASQQISSASEQLSAAAAEQAASLQETSASVEEISAMVNKNTENANQSREVSEVSHKSADTGRKSVDEMIGAVQAISQSNDEIGTRIQESNREFTDIVKVINEIGNKTKVINDIVFQTKLLSFNASVEAARAGEHGKGFAVVAEEVGNLAQMSGNAAKEISEMLEASTRQVESIVQRTQNDLERLMATGKDKVHTGQTVSERCGKILEEVVSQVSQMNRMSTEIASASSEQSQGVQEIGNAMRQLDQVTQQNASAAHQAASASTELSSQAEKLHGLVGDLTMFIQGGSTAGALPARSNHSGLKSQNKQKSKSNVVPMKKADASMKPVASDTGAFKAAAGSDINAPLDSDPRFRDI